MDWINNAGKLAGSISAVIALLTLVLFKPIKNAIKKRREDRDMQKKFQKQSRWKNWKMQKKFQKQNQWKNLKMWKKYQK